MLPIIAEVDPHKTIDSDDSGRFTGKRILETMGPEMHLEAVFSTCFYLFAIEKETWKRFGLAYG